MVVAMYRYGDALANQKDRITIDSVACFHCTVDLANFTHGIPLSIALEDQCICVYRLRPEARQQASCHLWPALVPIFLICHGMG